MLNGRGGKIHVIEGATNSTIKNKCQNLNAYARTNYNLLLTQPILGPIYESMANTHTMFLEKIQQLTVVPRNFSYQFSEVGQ